MKRILTSLATLFLIPCLPLIFMAVGQAASSESTTEANKKLVHDSKQDDHENDQTQGRDCPNISTESTKATE